MKLVFAAVALALTAGCVDGLTGASVDGEKAFLEDCAGCHGADAKGNGPMGEMEFGSKSPTISFSPSMPNQAVCQSLAA